MLNLLSLYLVFSAFYKELEDQGIASLSLEQNKWSLQTVKQEQTRTCHLKEHHRPNPASDRIKL